MRIPPRVPIDREIYSVVFGDARAASGDDEDCVGYCDFKKKIITLNANLRRNRRLLWWTFWHEVLEAFNYEYGLALNHDAQLDRLGRAFAYLAEDSGMDFPKEAPPPKKRRRPHP